MVWYRVASILHSNGDAYDVAVKDGKLVGVRGLATDRINHGRLGPKEAEKAAETTVEEAR